MRLLPDVKVRLLTQNPLAEGPELVVKELHYSLTVLMLIGAEPLVVLHLAQLRVVYLALFAYKMRRIDSADQIERYNRNSRRYGYSIGGLGQ